MSEVAVSQSTSPVANVDRIALILDALGAASVQGMRLGEICERCGLSKTAALRLLTGMTEQGVVERGADGARYFIALGFLSQLPGVLERLDLVNLLAPSMRALVDATEDSVYLSIRSGMISLCIARAEGRYPIKTLALEVGHRRPLGVGAGSLALLAFQKDGEIARIRERGLAARAAYGFDEVELTGLIEAARREGHAFMQGHVVPEMWAVGVPIYGKDGTPFAALSISCVADRLREPRRQFVVKLIAAEVARFEQAYAPLFTPVGVAAIQRYHASASSGVRALPGRLSLPNPSNE